MALRVGAGPPAYPSLSRLVVGAPWPPRAQRPPRTSRPTRAALIGRASKGALVKARAFLRRNATEQRRVAAIAAGKDLSPSHGWRERIGAADADFRTAKRGPCALDCLSAKPPSCKILFYPTAVSTPHSGQSNLSCSARSKSPYVPKKPSTRHLGVQNPKKPLRRKKAKTSAC